MDDLHLYHCSFNGFSLLRFFRLEFRVSFCKGLISPRKQGAAIGTIKCV